MDLDGFRQRFTKSVINLVTLGDYLNVAQIYLVMRIDLDFLINYTNTNNHPKCARSMDVEHLVEDLQSLVSELHTK